MSELNGGRIPVGTCLDGAPDPVNAPPHYNTDEALDEFADLMELWLQRRARGETPYHIKTAIMAVIKEIAQQ